MILAVFLSPIAVTKSIKALRFLYNFLIFFKNILIFLYVYRPQNNKLHP